MQDPIFTAAKKQKQKPKKIQRKKLSTLAEDQCTELKAVQYFFINS